MAIPSYDKYSKPFSDRNLEWNYDESRYVPTVEGVKENAYVNLVTDWGTVENAQSYLDLLSRVVNETILSYKDARYRDMMSYYMGHSKQARSEIMKIMLDSAWYNRRDGGFMMAYNSGANLNQGKLIEFGIDKALSSIAQQIVKNTYLGTRYLPFNINEVETFEDFDSFKAFLLNNEYIDQEQHDEAEGVKDLPLDNSYQLVRDLNGNYVFYDLKTMEKIIKKKTTFNPSTGTW